VRLLAVDTSTEHCSAALLADDGGVEWRSVPTDRSHAELLLPMIDELLGAAGWSLATLDGLAFGRGPGAFTGLRLAAGVVQGLAFALGLRVAAVSSLAAVAFQLAVAAGDEVLVCNDARMGEVYVGSYRREGRRMVLVGDESVLVPTAVPARVGAARLVAGNALARHAELRLELERRGLQIHDDLFPRADAVAALAADDFATGRTVAAADVAPVYVRDQVVQARVARTAVT
jgi:tRNA threonylcarbamoyladenosine biosynthesis protein TsaB